MRQGEQRRIWMVVVIASAAIALVSFLFYDPRSPAPQPSAALPVAVAWYAVVAVISTAILLNRRGFTEQALFAVAILALPVVAWTVYAALISHQPLWGPQIVGLVSSTTIFIAAAVSPRTQTSPVPDHKSKSVVGQLFVAATLVALVTVFLTPISRGRRVSLWTDSQAFSSTATARPTAVNVAVFSDYQCPACRDRRRVYDPVIVAAVSRYPGQIVFQYYDYPLENECNPNVGGSLHPAACEEAVAVRVAARHGQALQLGEYFFDHQNEANPSWVRAVMAERGLEKEFDEAYPTMLTLIRKDIERGVVLKVKGTPSYFVDGLYVDGWSAEFLQDVLARRVANLSR